MTRLMMMLLVVGCADSSDVDVDSGTDAGVDSAVVESTTIDLSFFGSAYTGAEVCMEGVCGIVGTDATFVVRPAIVGDRVNVAVRLGLIELEVPLGWSRDLEELGITPALAVSERMSIGLIRNEAGDCQTYRTNHVINSTSAFSFPPDEAQFQACGPFAD